MTNEENYNLPVNVKQIGTINDNTSRIYMEDYACTYIEQYAKAEPVKEKIAILAGKNINVDGDDVLFVSGVIQGKYTIKKNGMTELTEKSWQYIKKQMNLYFKDLEIVGWVYVQPGFEDYISENVCAFQQTNVSRGLQVLYIADPVENVNSFYKWNSNNEMFNQVKGYVIYYEKNEGMHEYMLENKIKDTVIEENNAVKQQDAGAAARAAATNRRSKYKSRLRLNNDSRKMINILGGVSFIMLMVCFVMGAGLVQNDERISSLEDKLAFLEASIRDSQSVFASQKITETTTQTTTMTTTQATTMQITTSSQPDKYVVKSGDTLIKICKEIYGNTKNVSKIKELNNLDGSTIVVGDTLLLP